MPARRDRDTAIARSWALGAAHTALVWTAGALGLELAVEVGFDRVIAGGQLNGEVLLLHPNETPGPLGGSATGIGTDVLGPSSVEAISVSAGAAGGSAILRFNQHRVGASGVQKAEQRWSAWFRSSPNAAWQPAGSVTLDLYVVLDRPTAPWDADPAGLVRIDQPWTRVLDLACGWADGHTTADAALAAVLVGLFDGDLAWESESPPDERFYYHPKPAAYTEPSTPWDQPVPLDLHRFLSEAVLSGMSQAITCTDVSALLMTFANVLGCGVLRLHLDPPNPPNSWSLLDFKGLGWADFGASGGGPSGSGVFDWHHTVYRVDDPALPPSSVADLRLYEGCFAADDDANRGQAPFKKVLVAGAPWARYLELMSPAPAPALVPRYNGSVILKAVTLLTPAPANLSGGGGSGPGPGPVPGGPGGAPGPSPLIPAGIPVVQALELLSATYGPAMAAVIPAIRDMEQASSRGGAPVAFELLSASTWGAPQLGDSIMLRARGPRPLAHIGDPLAPVTVVPLVVFEVFLTLDPSHASDLFDVVRRRWPRPGSTTAGVERLVFPGSQDRLVRDGPSLWSFREEGSISTDVELAGPMPMPPSG